MGHGEQAWSTGRSRGIRTPLSRPTVPAETSCCPSSGNTCMLTTDLAVISQWGACPLGGQREGGLPRRHTEGSAALHPSQESQRLTSTRKHLRPRNGHKCWGPHCLGEPLSLAHTPIGARERPTINAKRAGPSLPGEVSPQLHHVQGTPVHLELPSSCCVAALTVTTPSPSRPSPPSESLANSLRGHTHRQCRPHGRHCCCLHR